MSAPVPLTLALDKLAALQLPRLLQLASPGLPIGGYSYSQGLEGAVAARVVKDAPSLEAWLSDLLDRFLSRNDAVLWLLAFDAFEGGDAKRLALVNDWIIATRETRALRDEATQMGWSLLKLARELGWFGAREEELIASIDAPAYALVFAGCARAIGLARSDGVTVFLFAWLEGQLVAAQKLLPIGQAAAQVMLQRLGQSLPAATRQAANLALVGFDGVETSAPQFSILAARHGSQYSRLFRS